MSKSNQRKGLKAHRLHWAALVTCYRLCGATQILDQPARVGRASCQRLERLRQSYAIELNTIELNTIERQPVSWVQEAAELSRWLQSQLSLCVDWHACLAHIYSLYQQQQQQPQQSRSINKDSFICSATRIVCQLLILTESI